MEKRPGDAAALLRATRSRAGMSLRALATLAGTSAATLHDYENGRKEPRLSTLARLIEAAGCQLEVTARPAPSRFGPVDGLHPTVVRSLLLGEAIALHLEHDPDRVLATARENLAISEPAHRGTSAERWVRRWIEIIDRADTDEIRRILVGRDERSIELRHTNPFAGLLTEDEREQALERYRTWRRAQRRAA